MRNFRIVLSVVVVGMVAMTVAAAGIVDDQTSRKAEIRALSTPSTCLSGQPTVLDVTRGSNKNSYTLWGGGSTCEWTDFWNACIMLDDGVEWVLDWLSGSGQSGQETLDNSKVTGTYSGGSVVEE